MTAAEPDRRDPVFLNSRREALIILTAWATCLVWAVGYCQFAGYETPEGPVPKTMGIPSWVFFGVLVPWVLASTFSIVFSLKFMKDHDLGEGEVPSAEGGPDDA